VRIGPRITLIAACACASPPSERAADPGAVTLHRLNRTELNATVRDLLHTDLRPGDAFPSDDFGYGFDNVADVLSLSPLHLELAESTARELVEVAVLPPRVPPVTTIVEGESLDATPTVGASTGDAWLLWSNGDLSTTVDLPTDGVWRFAIGAWAQQAGQEVARMEVRLDGTLLGAVNVRRDTTEVFPFEVDVAAGSHTITASFVNDFWDDSVDPPLDRNLAVDFFEITGPIGATGPRPPGWSDVFTCDEADLETPECLDMVVRRFGQRAWRRPLTDDEVTRLTRLHEDAVAAGATWSESVGWVVHALLVSPNFWFRVELDADPADPTPHPLTSWELATRLSYFLWSSMPDDALFAAAADGSLLQDDVLDAQVVRMLDDPKASALVDGLGAQWLYAHAVDDAFPDPATFPTWDQELRASMKEEMRRAVADVLLTDAPLTDLLTSRKTWVDARLAEHYGIPAPSDGFAETTFEGTARTGILGRAGWLTALSYPARTSPTRRGAWILGNLLCEAPPPPPPNIPALVDNEEGEPPDSVRERLEQHRDDPVCASCHQLMDPIGLTLENYDGIGAWRDTDAGDAIDPSGSLPGGVTFDGPEALASFLATDPRFDRCAVQKTTIRALGRALTVEDLRYVDEIEASYVAGGRRFSDLARAVVLSDPFRMRRGGAR
jgi:hypothetical protein